MEVLSSRVLYRARDFTSLRHFYERVLGLTACRAQAPKASAPGVASPFLGVSEGVSLHVDVMTLLP